MRQTAQILAPEDDLWTAVVRRDPNADGRFIYSVLTTGVYCKPSCAARTPRRENVSFHPDCVSAARAGFRPCKRCRPNEAPTEARKAALVARLCRMMEESEEQLSLATLADDAGMSPSHLQRTFKRVLGVTPKAYASAQRALRLRSGLRRGTSVTAALHDAGFGSSSRLYAASDKLLGMEPSVYRRGGLNADIRFAAGECSLGSIVVAVSDKGVCAILLGDEPQALIDELHDHFPSAQLLGGDANFDDWVAQVVGFVDDSRVGLGLPLDIRGTAFQQRVWRALTEIPVGSTASYAEIAAKIGSPGASRAVAGACAANTIAVAIPCHRVVRQDGSLSGYRWGVDRKQALLSAESAVR